MLIRRATVPAVTGRPDLGYRLWLSRYAHSVVSAVSTLPGERHVANWPR